MFVKTFLKRPEFVILIIVLMLLALRPWVRYSEGVMDSAAYAFGAETIASGHFALNPPPENFRIVHCVLDQDKFYSRFFPGTLLAGALGIRLFGTWYVINVLILGGIICLLADLCRKIADDPLTAWLPLCLIGIFIDLPNEVFTLHSILHSAFWTLLFIWSLYRGLISGQKWFCALAGFAVGFSAITRPMLPAILIVITCCILLFQTVKTGKKGWPALLFFTVPVLLNAGFQLFYNYLITGKWLTLPWSQYDPHSKMGLGLRGDHASGAETMFTLVDVLRNLRSIIWGEFAILIPLFLSIVFLAWCLVIFFSRKRNPAGNSLQPVPVIAFILSAGTLLYLLGMCFFYWGLEYRYYYLEVNLFTIIFLAVIAGEMIRHHGKTAKKTILLSMIIFSFLGLYESVYGIHIGIKTTNRWEMIFSKFETLAGDDKTLFILHKKEESEDPGRKWALGNYRTQHLWNSPEMDGKWLFAVSLGGSDRLLEERYSGSRKILHVVINRRTGMVKELKQENAAVNSE